SRAEGCGDDIPILIDDLIVDGTRRVEVDGAGAAGHLDEMERHESRVAYGGDARVGPEEGAADHDLTRRGVRDEELRRDRRAPPLRAWGRAAPDPSRPPLSDSSYSPGTPFYRRGPPGPPPVRRTPPCRRGHTLRSHSFCSRGA